MADTSLYARLKRLFSTNVVVRNVGGTRLKVADTDNIQSFMSNAIRDRYSRVYSGSGYGMSGGSYGVNMAFQTQRLQLFRDYDTMDNDPIIASALDVYSDESTVKNEFGQILTIATENEKIKDVLHNLFYDILNIEFNLWPWVRNLCKYGDFFLFLEISPEYGIVNVMPLSPYDTVRIEGEDPKNPAYVRFETVAMQGTKTDFENYEIAHFRLMSDSNFLPYGKSMIENARRIFRQLSMMEDAMLIHRIMRAPEKRVFRLDIGNIPPSEVEAYIQSMMDKSKKVPFIDPQTGDYNLRYNIQNLMEDFYLPVRGSDSGTSIENLSGLNYDSIDDVEYLRNKLMSALKIPKAFLGYEEGVNGKATLAAEDVRFARTIERIQRILVSELTKIAIVHLFAQGFTDEDLLDFNLSLTNPSTIYEQEKINLWTQKVSLITQLQQTKLLSTDWMYDKILNISEDEANRERDLVSEDIKRMFRLSQIEQGQPDPAKFGYPQEHEAPPEGEEVSGMGGAGDSDSAGSDDSADGDTGGITSIDDLPTAAELGLEESLDEIDTETRGRPKSGSQYAQDSHVRGRDPLGFKDRYNSMKVSSQRSPTYKSPLSLESRLAIKNMSKLTQKSLLSLNENIDELNVDSDSGTYLDERLLIDKTTDTV